MTALFATRRFFNIDAVYDSELQKKLKNELNFLDPLKSFDELDARKEELQTVDYIFSTWGMLPLTKEQILEYFPNLKSVFYAAGTVQAFVPAADVEGFRTMMDAVFGEGASMCLSIRPLGAVKLFGE